MPDFDDLMEDYRGDAYEVTITVRSLDGRLIEMAVIPEAKVSTVMAHDVDIHSWAGIGPVRLGAVVRQFRITTLGEFTIRGPGAIASVSDD